MAGAGLKKLTEVVDALGTTTGVCCPEAGFEKLTDATAANCCRGAAAGAAGLKKLNVVRLFRTAGTVGCEIGAGLKKLTAVVDALGTTTGVCCPGTGFEKLTDATVPNCLIGPPTTGAGLK